MVSVFHKKKNSKSRVQVWNWKLAILKNFGIRLPINYFSHTPKKWEFLSKSSYSFTIYFSFVTFGISNFKDHIFEHVMDV